MTKKQNKKQQREEE